jgi:hypothetical protein
MRCITKNEDEMPQVQGSIPASSDSDKVESEEYQIKQS